MHAISYRSSFFIVLILFPLYAMSQSLGNNSTLMAALKAQGSLQLEKSHALFESVVANPKASKEDRCEALRELAIQDWKVRKDYDQAKRRLLLADSLGGYRSETWLKLLRVEEESTHFSAARDAGLKAILLSVSKADKTYAQYKYANVILQEAIAQVNKGSAFDVQLVADASEMVQEVLQINPTNTEAAAILLGVSLLRNDGDTAYKAWLSYFRFSNAAQAYSYLKEPSLQLERLLVNQDIGTLTDTQKYELIIALGASRFYHYAALLVSHLTVAVATSPQEIQNIVAYATYLEDIKNFTNEYYQKSTLKEITETAFRADLSVKNEILYHQVLQSEVKKDTFSYRNFTRLIRNKFGAVFMIARTSSSNITGLLFGHIVNERIRTVEQYEHEAEFAFTELDMMVSNGYPSWFWENRGAGGFAIRGGFIRVKSMFKHLGILAWERITDQVKRQEVDESIHKNLLMSTSTSDENTILAALAKKLERDGLDALHKELLDDGYTGMELQREFIRRYDLYRDNATMFAHEGRHSLDRVVLGDEYSQLGIAVLEYRARLSQIVFSESPKLELANMVNGTGTTGAGQANKMIVDVIEKYVKTNQKEIEDFDHSKQAISQIYKLTNEQLKSCFRAVDPFYKL